MKKGSYKVLVNILKRNLLILLITLPIIGFLYSIFTGIIKFENSIYFSIMSKNSIFALIIISILTSILLTLQISLIKERIKIKGTKVGFFGTFLSFLTTACPFCKPLLISIIGLSSSTALLAKYGIQITIFSILLLITSIFIVSKNITKTKLCEKC